MNLIDSDRLITCMPHRPVLQPIRIRPAKSADIGNDRGSCRWTLGIKSDGIGPLRQEFPGNVANFVFIDRAGQEPRHEDFPKTRSMAQPHRMSPAIPVIEVSYHRYTLGGRGPDGKSHTEDIVDGLDLRTQDRADITVGSLGDQM